MGNSRGWPFHDAQQDYAERFLHLREFEKMIEDELAFLAAFYFDHDAHTVAIGFIAHVGNTFDFFRLHEFGDALDKPRFIYLERNFGDDDAFAIFRRRVQSPPWRAW